MVTSINRAGFWNEQVWATIDEGVTKAIGPIRVAQQVFPTVLFANATSVPADEFNPQKMSISEGLTKPFVELAVGFPLTNGQVTQDSAGMTATTLAKLAAKSLALAEDLIFLQGGDVDLPKAVRIESGGESLGDGILGLVPSHHRIVVDAPNPNAPTNSGGVILAAVAKGIALLTAELQAPPFALIEDTGAYAATWGSVINGGPAYTVLNALLAGGIFCTGAMPANTGLLVALGGDPTTIYSGTDPVTEPTHKSGTGQYLFRTFERVQFVARDPRSFVRLDFTYLGPPPTPELEPAQKRG
jgi:hypothetical protein